MNQAQARRARLLAVSGGPLLGLAGGCFEGSVPDETDAGVCAPGSRGCECTPDLGCEAGLECVDGVCVGDETGDTGDGDPTTGDGDGDPNGDGDPMPGQCYGPDDCAADEYCDFADDFCGELAAGMCARRPNIEDCGNGFGVTGCDCQTYPGTCEAAAAGVDFKCIGECC